MKEAAARLRTCPATVYSLCASRRLEYVLISTNAIRILAEDLRRFVQTRRQSRRDGSK